VVEATFYELPLLTEPGRVMTPRRATERLVAAAAEHLGGRPGRVADVGTGSGAIAVSLVRLAPQAEIWASDVSFAAVSLARANARRYGVGGRVHVVRGDLLEPLPGELDLIVANLPYLPAADRSRYLDLAAEPDDALFAPGDELGLYRRLFRSAEDRLQGGGVVMIQLHRRVFSFERAELAAVAGGLARLVPDRRTATPARRLLREPAVVPAAS
jgi:release factor glutamine methyltransferase